MHARVANAREYPPRYLLLHAACSAPCFVVSGHGVHALNELAVRLHLVPDVRVVLANLCPILLFAPLCQQPLYQVNNPDHEHGRNENPYTPVPTVGRILSDNDCGRDHNCANDGVGMSSYLAIGVQIFVHYWFRLAQSLHQLGQQYGECFAT